ncbi:MAG: hypothetical protein DME57_00305 [Verrucomicrobia bacterium]|nr:MAG: hypothetical protein DME57_00305 [Verrucomicrobiota bacterium]
MKAFLATLMLVLSLYCASSVYAGDGFESVKCGSDVLKALVGHKMSDEPVVDLEARHKDIQLKDLGAEEITEQLNLIFWMICGEEYAVLEDGDFVRDMLKFPKHSKESPQFVSASCQSNGKELPDTLLGVLKNEEGGDMLPAVKAWKIDEKQKKFVEFPTDGLRCPRSEVSTADGGK